VDVTRKTNKLTAVSIRNLSEPGRYGDGNGLYLTIAKDGAKRWALIYQMAGRRREMGLGNLSAVTLAQARELARGAHGLIAKGIDPIDARSRPPGIPTFAKAGEELIADLSPGWTGAKTEESWARSFNSHAAVLAKRSIDSIGTDDVLRVLRPIWATKAESAGKLRERIERLLDYAKAQGWRSGENPARWKGHLALMLPPRQKLTRGHHRSLPYLAMPEFMADLRGRRALASKALEFTILTAAREDMALSATWSEISGDLWTVPASRAKRKPGDLRPHRVPLSPAVMVLLDSVRPRRAAPSAYIFPGEVAGRPLSNQTMDRLLWRMKVDATPHGFRSTFRDWAGDCTDFPREVAEEALAHTIGDDVERAYRRVDALEKRRKLMAAWADYCATPPPSEQ
jgi:integrase